MYTIYILGQRIIFYFCDLSFDVFIFCLCISICIDQRIINVSESLDERPTKKRKYFSWAAEGNQNYSFLNPENSKKKIIIGG